MVVVADSESWQRIFQLMTEKSRWDLPDDDVSIYLSRSFDFIVDLMQRMDTSEPYELDPSGADALHLAKRVRRAVLRNGGEEELLQEAQRHFGLPTSTLTFAASLSEPIYLPGRAVA